MSVLLSGPVDVTVLDYQGIKFILFSDLHFSLEGVCDIQCENMTSEPKCYTVTSFISKIIENANIKQQYVDVYLETPLPGPRAEALRILKTNPLSIPIDAYFDCLYNKELCPYKNARFHYVDVRAPPEQGHSTIYADMSTRIYGFISSMASKNASLMFTSKKDTLTVHLNFFTYDFIINVFLNKTQFIDSNLWAYYNLCIISDNFVNDVESYLGDLLIFDTSYVEDTIALLTHRFQGEHSSESIRAAVMAQIPNIIRLIRAVLLPRGLIAIKYDEFTGYKRVMHKVRAQLFGLESQGDNERAESLRQFIQDEFSTKNLTASVGYFKEYNTARIAYLNDNNPMWFKTVPEPSSDVVRSMLEQLRIDGLMMDLYTLARMFRTFPVQFRTINKLTDTHIYSSYIIEYAGASHIETMIKYLTSTGAQIVPFDVIKLDKRCLSIPAEILE